MRWVADTIRFYGNIGFELGPGDLKILHLLIPEVEAKERLRVADGVHAGNVKQLVLLAEGDEKLANKVEDMYLMRMRTK